MCLVTFRLIVGTSRYVAYLQARRVFRNCIGVTQVYVRSLPLPRVNSEQNCAVSIKALNVRYRTSHSKKPFIRCGSNVLHPCETQRAKVCPPATLAALGVIRPITGNYPYCASRQLQLRP